MNARMPHPLEDRILVSGRGRRKAMLSAPQRRFSPWTIAGGVVGSPVLLWVMVQMGQASPNAKEKPSPLSQPHQAAVSSSTQPAVLGSPQQSGEGHDGQSDGPPATGIQGPALEVPREVLGMLDLRKRNLDRREEAVRQHEERLLVLRGEIDKLLAKNEAVAKRIEMARAKEEQQAAGSKTALAKALLEKERLAQEQKMQLAKMYETMPSEDAAARLERMPDRAAIQILRLVKTKTAGAILAQVKPERAAKLTEQLLAQTP